MDRFGPAPPNIALPIGRAPFSGIAFAARS